MDLDAGLAVCFRGVVQCRGCTRQRLVRFCTLRISVLTDDGDKLGSLRLNPSARQLNHQVRSGCRWIARQWHTEVPTRCRPAVLLDVEDAGSPPLAGLARGAVHGAAERVVADHVGPGRGRPAQAEHTDFLSELVGRDVLDDVGGAVISGGEEPVELAQGDAVELVTGVDSG